MNNARTLLSIGLFLATGPAFAGNEWSINASSCVANPGSIKEGLLLGTAGTIKFDSGKTGNIVVYCPVPNRLGFTPSLLRLLYWDDSPVAGNHVTGQLIRMALDTGQLHTVSIADSDQGASSADGHACQVEKRFTESINPTAYAYYIRVDIARTVATANETLYGVSLLD